MPRTITSDRTISDILDAHGPRLYTLDIAGVTHPQTFTWIDGIHLLAHCLEVRSLRKAATQAMDRIPTPCKALRCKLPKGGWICLEIIE